MSQKAGDDEAKQNRISTLFRGMSPDFIQWADDTYYTLFDMTQQIKPKEMLRLILNFRVRADDVFTVGYPRCGNHWAFEVVTMVLQQNTQYAEENFFKRLLELKGPDIQERFDTIEAPRILGTHLRLSKLPRDLLVKRPKIVYLLRNPKDNLVSIYHYVRTMKSPRFKYTGTWEEYFQTQMSEEFLFGSWFEHALELEKFMEDNPDIPVHVHSFERMKERPVEAISELCTFLERPAHLAPDIARATEYGTMTGVLAEGRMKPLQDLLTNDRGSILGIGSVGSWRSAFTEAQNEAFNKKFEEKMAGSKLADLVRPYL